METQSVEISELVKALSKMQGQMELVAKNSENPYFKNRYADLAALWDALRKPLSENGLAVIQTTADDSEGVTLFTMLAHSSGQWIKGTLRMKPVKSDPQGVGSCITYARRYALSAILGLATEDDDGNAASSPGNQSVNVNQPKRLSEQAKTAILDKPIAQPPAQVAPGLPRLPQEATKPENGSKPPKPTENAPKANYERSDTAKAFSVTQPLEVLVDCSILELKHFPKQGYYQIKTEKGREFRTRNNKLIEIAKGGRDTKSYAWFVYKEKYGYGELVSIEPDAQATLDFASELKS